MMDRISGPYAQADLVNINALEDNEQLFGAGLWARAASIQPKRLKVYAWGKVLNGLVNPTTLALAHTIVSVSLTQTTV